MIKIKEFKARLTRINKTEPLTPLSLVLIICLDIFILVNIFTGLDNQSSQLVSPSEYIPWITRSIIIEENWVEGNRISKLSNIVLNEYRRTYYKEEDTTPKHPICVEMLDVLSEIQSDEKLIEVFREREKLYKNYNSIEKDLKESDKALQLLNQIEQVDAEINKNETVTNFWSIIENSADLSEELTKDLRRLNYTYPIKKVLFEFLFLIPLLAIFIFWHFKSLKKSRNLQVLISSHLIVVSMIPILIKLITLVLDIIPDKILKTFINFLKSINLIAIWHYILIAVAVLVTLLLIFIIQKKVFSRERLIKKRFSKSQCIECSKKINSNIKFCPNCGTDQKVNCKSCMKETFKGGDFCIHCGVKQ